MKISQAFRDAYRTAAGQKGETLKFLATEAALTAVCFVPLLFLLAEGPLKYAAALAVPLWLLVKNPARINAAAAMQDSLGEGKIFSLRLGDPGNYGRKVLYGLGRLGLLLLWALPTIAALSFAWTMFNSGGSQTNGLTVMQAVYDLGGKDTTTGIFRLLLILAALLIVFALGTGFHSGDRHAYVLDRKGMLKGKRSGVLRCWLCGLLFTVPLIAAAAAVVCMYLPVLSNMGGAMTGDVPKPSTKLALAILGAGAALTLPLVPLRVMVTAAYVNGLKKEKTGETDA